MKWILYTRGTIPLHRLAVGILGIHEFAAKTNPSRLDKILYIVIGPKMWWGWDKQETILLGKKVLKICADKKAGQAYYKKIRNCFRQAILAADKIRQLDLKKYSDEKLALLYDGLYRDAALAHAAADASIDAIDYIFEDFFQKKLRQQLPADLSDIKVLEHYQFLSQPAYESFVAVEEKTLLSMALKESVSQSELLAIQKRFWWTQMGWENLKVKTIDDFKKIIIKDGRDRNTGQKLNELKMRSRNILSRRSHLIKKYKLSLEIKHWLKIIDLVALYHDQRKEMQVKTIFSFDLLLRETARRLNLAHRDLEYLWFDEVKDLLRGKKYNQKEIARRKKALLVLVSRQGIVAVSGEKAMKRFKSIIKDDSKKITEIRGLGVMPGNVIGKVKVCAGIIEALKKIKSGDILVCGMTTPDYVPVMKKAAAVITDEGGLTCHAAIVSRELGIPCVVGTKIATKVLKDGDLVEVDANKGIVKKI